MAQRGWTSQSTIAFSPAKDLALPRLRLALLAVLTDKDTCPKRRSWRPAGWGLVARQQVFDMSARDNGTVFAQVHWSVRLYFCSQFFSLSLNAEQPEPQNRGN